MRSRRPTFGAVDRLLAVHESLARLATVDPRSSRIVEPRFLGGLTEAGIALELGLSERWVREQWAHARAWLRRERNGHGERR